MLGVSVPQLRTTFQPHDDHAKIIEQCKPEFSFAKVHGDYRARPSPAAAVCAAAAFLCAPPRSHCLPLHCLAPAHRHGRCSLAPIDVKKHAENGSPKPAAPSSPHKDAPAVASKSRLDYLASPKAAPAGRTPRGSSRGGSEATSRRGSVGSTGTTATVMTEASHTSKTSKTSKTSRTSRTSKSSVRTVSRQHFGVLPADAAPPVCGHR